MLPNKYLMIFSTKFFLGNNVKYKSDEFLSTVSTSQQYHNFQVYIQGRFKNHFDKIRYTFLYNVDFDV